MVKETFDMIVKDLDKMYGYTHLSPGMVTLDGTYTLYEIQVLFKAMQNGIYYDVTEKKYKVG